MKDSTYNYLLQMIPLLLACISVIAVTLLCGNRWVIVAIELPIWAILFWWWHLQGVICAEEAKTYHLKTPMERLREEQQQPPKKYV